jgi:Tol biopolymer transport system component
VGEDLPGEGLIEQYAWSPDSASLAFTYNTAYNGGGVNLYVAPADGSDLRKLTTIWPATEPAWSPDGEWIAASDVIGNFASAYIVRSDGSERREIGEGLHDSGQPAWSPDGRSVAFPGSVTDEFGQQRLFEYDLERGERRIVAPDVTLAFFPIITFSRDGERIFFTADAPPCMEGCPPGRLFMIERKSDSLPTRLSDDLVSELLRWQP